MLKRIKRNIITITNSFEFFPLNYIKGKRYILLFFLVFCAILYGMGFRIIKAISNSDQNGIYLALPSKWNVNYNKGNYVAVCFPDKENEKYAELFGLTKSSLCQFGGAPLVKHVCATSGDTMKYNNLKNSFVLNGKISLDLPIPSKDTVINRAHWESAGEVSIPYNNYFVCGKNHQSYDSRYFGLVGHEFMHSRLILLLPLPYNHFLKE